MMGRARQEDERERNSEESIGVQGRGRRSVGLRRLRCEDRVGRDVQKLRGKSWWMIARDMDTWRRTLKED